MVKNMKGDRAQTLRLLKVKSAISEFIWKTQKIVKSVDPNAQIVISKNLPKKRLRKSKDLPEAAKPNTYILVPDFRSKIHLVRDQKN